MARSLNHWTVLPPGSLHLATGVIPGTNRKLTTHKAVLPLFLAIGYDWNDWIAPLMGGPVDEGGYAYRQSNGSDGWSNHASGSAVDYNWNHEGAQRPANRAFWTKPANHARIDQIKTIYHVTWGGDWHGSYWDPMHLECPLGSTPTSMAKVVRFLGIDAKGVRHNNWNGVPLDVPRG